MSDDRVTEILYTVKTTLDLMMKDSERQANRETEVSYIGYWRGRESAFEYARDLVDNAMDALNG